MVPTEILAQQHMESLQQLFDPLEVRTALLTGSTKTKERRLILEELANGEIDIVVGTHALIQQDVSFHQLGLVITDEQHRFGVNQRKILREKGLDSAAAVRYCFRMDGKRAGSRTSSLYYLSLD